MGDVVLIGDNKYKQDGNPFVARGPIMVPTSPPKDVTHQVGEKTKTTNKKINT